VAGLPNTPLYVRHGLYATHLNRWLENFPALQLLAVTREDIEREPLAVAPRLYAFVGVDTAFEPPGIRQRFNVSYANRSQGLRRVKDWAYKAASLPGLRWTWSLGHALGLRAMYRKVNTVPSAAAIPEPSAELLDALRQQFLPEVQELSWLLDRPLDAWTRAARTAPSRPGLGNTLRSAEQSS
jgi:hypothetical protein